MIIVKILTKKLMLSCYDMNGRIWGYEYVSLFNFWHKWVWNKWPNLMPKRAKSGDGIYQPNIKLCSFFWRKI